MKKLPEVHGQDQVQVGRDLVSLLQAAEKEAIKRGDQFVAGELFLLALADSKSDLGNAARAQGLTRKSLESAIAAVRGGQNVDSADAEEQRESLKKYCVDLTERARMGKLDPVAFSRQVYKALKPGGVFLVVDHTAEAGSGLRDTDTLHRIDPAIVKTEVEAAGFKFEGESPALKNPADNLKTVVFDKAIRGHTDQFIYKFRKPK